ncbi:MAG: DsrH/TusB family sulfur metabolism protein [Candidatus Odinarchaeota archaeon]
MKSTLYLCNKSPYNVKGFETLLKMVNAQANRGVKTGLALLQDAVACITGEASKKLNELSKSVKIYILLEDVKARGLADLNSISSPVLVTYKELVNIIVKEYDRIVNYL